MAQFHFTCSEIWQSMLADCAGARKSIEMEQYIIHDDVMGNRFLTLLRDKAKEGVKVRLLLDRIGSRDIYDHPLLQEIKGLGGKVRFYNHLRWRNLFTPHRWFPRNHAKVMVIDGRIVHIGSAGLDDAMANWREAHARLEGKVVHNLHQDFIYEQEGQAAPHYRYMASRPGRRNPVYREILARIDIAKHSVYLATPYFLPPLMLQMALRRALKRKIDVRLLTGEETDVPIARLVGQTYFKKMIALGTRIFLYRPTIMHAKYIVVDDDWAVVGSVNLDYLSLLRNREASLCVEDHSAVAALKAQFTRDADNNARALDRHFWEDVPFYEKIIGYLGRGLKKVL